MSSNHFLITGATGLIGSALVRHLLDADAANHLILPVRNVEKARALHGDSERIEYIYHDFSSMQSLKYDGPVDYIIHGANTTSSAYMAEHPVDTAETILCGTMAMLQFAMQKRVKAIVYLSSMEVYGHVATETQPLREEQWGEIDIQSPRSSYPMAKRMAEYLCRSYAIEHGVPVRVARLVQTFGPGVDLLTDNRVFAQFARAVRTGQDICLSTEGHTKRMYLHVQDAVSAILCLLEHGVDGEVYNVANPQTYCSIREMAEWVKNTYAPTIQVRIEPKANPVYPQDTYLCLSVEKINALGWYPRYDLKAMYDDMLI